MRVLVTGSSGFVGGAIAARLHEAGMEVIGLSRRPTASLPPARQVQADIARSDLIETVNGAIAPCDAVVHAAASLDLRDAASISLVNCFGTQQVLQLARRWQCRTFVFISSLPVIGRPQFLPITEDHPTNPPTEYHASKLFGEHLVRLAERDGTSCCSLRLVSPIGPGMPEGRIVSVFVRRAMQDAPIELAGHGTRRQNYIDVRDIAAAVEACLIRRPQGIFNIASDRSISNHELAQTCVATLKSASPVAFTGRDDPDDRVSWDVSIDRARTILDFEPSVSLKDSIRDIARSMQEFGAT